MLVSSLPSMTHTKPNRFACDRFRSARSGAANSVRSHGTEQAFQARQEVAIHAFPEGALGAGTRLARDRLAEPALRQLPVEPLSFSLHPPDHLPLAQSDGTKLAHLIVRLAD